MKAFVITMLNEPRSVAAAHRCIRSGAEHGTVVEQFGAVTARDDPIQLMADLGFSTTGFGNNPYSRLEPCLAAFISHSMLWDMARTEREPVLVLEHDAVFAAALPQELRKVRMFCNLGKPSFGAFEVPPPGLGPFVSKAGGYLGGAHAYYVTPAGAQILLGMARAHAEPTDIFLNRHRFPWLQEYYPWPVVCDDSFSTIQYLHGCVAKHNRVEPI